MGSRSVLNGSRLLSGQRRCEVIGVCLTPRERDEIETLARELRRSRSAVLLDCYYARREDLIHGGRSRKG